MSELRYAAYGWPMEPIAVELSGPVYPEVADQLRAMHCPGCGLGWDEMPTGHTWRADGSECWNEDEDDDE